MLNWEEVRCSDYEFTKRSWLKARFLALNIDFSDLVNNNGSAKLYLDLSFSIHTRLLPSDGWTHSLHAPNGIHVNCKSVDEAKVVANKMFKRINDAMTERFSTDMARRVLKRSRLKNVKRKREKLMAALESRKIHFVNVYYTNSWYIFTNDVVQLLGSNYEQALDMINSGTLDYEQEKEQFGLIEQVGG